MPQHNIMTFFDIVNTCAVEAITLVIATVIGAVGIIRELWW